MNNSLILVNEEDEEIGYCEKWMHIERSICIEHFRCLSIIRQIIRCCCINVHWGNIIQVVYGQTHVVRIRGMERI